MRVSLPLVLLIMTAGAAEPARAAPPLAADLPHVLKPGEFPPKGSEHRLSGELVEADFIHRTGQFRTSNGELVDFTLLPFATVMYLHAEADLRDVPLGTLCQFSLYHDERGAFTKVAAVHDEFSRLVKIGHTYRVNQLNLDAGSLEVTTGIQGDLKIVQIAVDNKTRIWKGNGKGKLSDLAIGDELLINLSGNSPTHSRKCADIWVGAESKKLATEQQQKRHEVFLRERGLPAWIERVEGKKLTVTLFGDPISLQAFCKQEGIVPSQWAAEHRGVDAAVANEELRTYNPPVDRRRATVVEFQQVSTETHGCSGIRWVIEPDLLLEGFRKGRVIRLFAHPSWPINDMPFGESLYSEAPDVKVGLEEPSHYNYRTDFANEHLPWYRLKPGVFPPFQSHHLVCGELIKVDVAHRSGQFRTDRTGELVDFSMPPFGTVRYLNSEGDLGDLPLGTRYRFFLHQDEHGTFAKASVISDDYSDLANDQLSYRLDAVEVGEGRIFLSKRHAPIKNEKEDLIQPPDLGRAEFAMDSKTRVWKGDRRIELDGLKVGDEVLVNLSGSSATSRGACTDIWVGKDTHKLATDRQRSKHDAFLQGNGLPAQIDSVEGKSLTITFFSGDRRDFRAVLDRDVKGEGLTLVLANEELRPVDGPTAKLRCKNQFFDNAPGGTYGCSGIRWHIESERVDKHFRPGQVVRVYREGWPVRDNSATTLLPDRARRVQD